MGKRVVFFDENISEIDILIRHLRSEAVAVPLNKNTFFDKILRATETYRNPIIDFVCHSRSSILKFSNGSIYPAEWFHSSTP